MIAEQLTSISHVLGEDAHEKSVGPAVGVPAGRAERAFWASRGLCDATKGYKVSVQRHLPQV